MLRIAAAFSLWAIGFCTSCASGPEVVAPIRASGPEVVEAAPTKPPFTAEQYGQETSLCLFALVGQPLDAPGVKKALSTAYWDQNVWQWGPWALMETRGGALSEPWRVASFDVATWLLPGGIEPGTAASDAAKTLHAFGFSVVSEDAAAMTLRAGPAEIRLALNGTSVAERAQMSTRGTMPFHPVCLNDAPWYDLAGSDASAPPAADAGCLASLLDLPYSSAAVSHLLASYPEELAVPGSVAGRDATKGALAGLEWGHLDGAVTKVSLVFGNNGPDPIPWLPPGLRPDHGVALATGALLAGGWRRVAVNTFEKGDVVVQIEPDRDRWIGLIAARPSTRGTRPPAPAVCAAMRDVKARTPRAGCIEGNCINGVGTFRTGPPFTSHGGAPTCDYAQTRFDGAVAAEGTLRCDGKEIWKGRFAKRLSKRRSGSTALLWWPAGRGFWRGRDGTGPRVEVDHDSTVLGAPE